MLIPTRLMNFYKKYGFRKCKGEYGKNGCYYLCVNVGKAMIFLSPALIEIQPWRDDDPRIHANPNCRYKDRRNALEIICEMAMDWAIKIAD